MALAAVDVCNQALALLGQKAITDLNGGDVHSRLCAAVYETVRDELLSVREWAFATFWRTLSPLSAPPGNPRFTNQYQRPAGVLRVLEACTEAGETDLDWVPEGDVILTQDLAGSGTGGSAPSVSPVTGVGLLADAFVWEVAGLPLNISGARVTFHLAPDLSGDFDVGRIYIEVAGVLLYSSLLTGELPELGAPWANPVDLGDFSAGGYAGDPDALDGLTLQLLDCPSDPPIPNGMRENLWTFDIGTPREAGTGLLKVRCLEQVTDPSDWPPYFVAAVVARLAYELAIPVTENMQALAAMERRAVAKLREAAAVDGMQGRNLTRRTDTLANKRRG